MARKNLLQWLMEELQPPADEPVSPAAPAYSRADAARLRYGTGATGAVSRSVTDVDPGLIDTAGLRDRFDSDEGGLAALAASIAAHGQQVPVLLRPHPKDPVRFQVVYGRRCVAALQQLGQPVTAMVRVLDDQALVIAQGQENAARKDLSFIEKANFARQMRDAGYERKVICVALHMDKTLISGMLSIADRIPQTLIEAIGAAPSVGRGRWLKLANHALSGDLTAAAAGPTSDASFEAVMAALTPQSPAPKAQEEKHEIRAIHDGSVVATAERKRGKTVFTVSHKKAPDFVRWLVENVNKRYHLWVHDQQRLAAEAKQIEAEQQQKAPGGGN